MARKKRKKRKSQSYSGANGKRQWGMEHVLHDMETKGKIGNTLHRTVYQMGTVVVGGALATALMGKHALWGGALMAVAGNYLKIPGATEVGLGAMAASAFIPWDDQSTVKGRFKTLYDKTGIPKLISKTSSRFSGRSPSEGERSEGEGEPGESISGVPASLEALNQIEQQLVSSAMAFQTKRGSQTSGLGATRNTREVDLSLM